VKCNKAADIHIDGTITQTRKGQRVQSKYSQDGVACTPGACTLPRW
jgi:hypothetical protein